MLINNVPANIWIDTESPVLAAEVLSSFGISFSDHPRRKILFSGVEPGRKSHLLRGEEVYQVGRL